jgi:hypothetical protein
LNDPFYEEDIPLRIDPYGEFEEVPLELEAPVYSVP